MKTMMDSKVTSIVAYAGVLCGAFGFVPGAFGIVGMFFPAIVWAVAFFLGDKNGALLHLNQTLNLIIVGFVGGLLGKLIGLIPIIGFIGTILGLLIWVGTLVFGILGLISAIEGSDKKLPYIGDIALIK